MSTSFTPPSPSQWEGPAQDFTPPPVSSWQGPAKENVTSSIRYLATEEPSKPPVQQQGLLKSFAEWAVKPLADIGAVIGSVNPADYMRAGQTISDFGNMLIGEPKRIWNDLVRSGDAMRKGDAPTAAYHLGGAFPMLGEPSKQITSEIAEGKYQDAFGHYLALIAPGVAERGLPTAGAAIETARVATPGAIRGGITAATQKLPYGAALAGEVLGGHEGAAITAGLVKAPAVIKGIVQGARESLATAAEQTAAEQAAAIARREAADTALARQARAGEATTAQQARRTARESAMAAAAEADARAAAAQAPAPAPQPITPTEAPPTPALAAPPPPAPAAPPEPAAPTPEPAPPAGKPQAAEIAAQLEASMRAETLTDYLVRNKVPASMLEQFGDREWQMVSQQAGVQPPTPENIQTIRSNIAQYETAATQPPEAGALTPAAAEADFQTRRAVRTRRKPPAVAAEAAPTQLESQLAESLETVQAGKRPAAQPAPAEGPRPPTASETRVEGIAQHLAADTGIELSKLETMAESPNSLAQLENLGRALDIEGRPTAEEIPQIIERVRELRGQGPTPAETPVPPEAGVRDLLSRPDDVANAAMQRMRKRGTFSGTKLSAGIDPADVADLSMYGAAKLVKGAQKIAGGISDFQTWANEMARDFGEAIIPQLDELWQRSRAIADRVTKDVKRRSMEDLDVRIPDEVRVVSQDPTRTVTGQPFHSLPLDQPGEGFLPLRSQGPERANQVVQQAFQDAIRESEAGGGATAAEAVKATGARPPDAEFWDKSFSLPQRARFWYELSGESFTGKHVDVPRKYQPAVIDAVAGTSGGVEPYANLKRGLGILAEDLQKQPVMTDLRDPSSARKALNPEAQNLESLKYGSFSGTMQHTSGLTPKPPLTTNDVQVASMFGISGKDIGQNPVLYEVLSRFFLKLRDAQNAELPAGGQPWETYQMQAPSWVYERIRKNPAKAAEYDDYSQVFPRVIQELKDAGIPTPGGKITMETLMDPRTPNVMSGTRERFLGTPVGTVEVATNRTARGLRAAEMRTQLDSLDPEIPWVRKAREGYEQIQRNTMYALAERQAGERSLVSQLMGEIVGRPVDVSRLDPNGYGTFEGAVNPNLRIPMTGRTSSGAWVNLSKTQREAFLSILGQDLQQDAMAASHFETVPHGKGSTYSVFVNRYDNQVNPQAIAKFSDTIGFPVNVAQHPNGVLIDVNIGGMDRTPTLEQIQDAAQATFGSDPNVKQIGYLAREYASDYIDRSGYRKAINAHERTQRTVADKPRGSGQTGSAEGQPSSLDRVRQAIQDISRQRDADFAKWTKATSERLEKHLARPPKTTQTLRELMQPE